MVVGEQGLLNMYSPHAGFFFSEGEAFGAIAPITIEAAIKNDMEKQLADSLELFEYVPTIGACVYAYT